MDDRTPTHEHVERADFAPRRVGGRGGRGWGPLLIAGWIVVLGAVVGAGTLGRTLDGSTGTARPSLPIRAPSSSAVAGPVFHPVTQPAPGGPLRSSDPDPLAYTVVRGRAGLSITGTVLARPVVWVFISIQDAAGDVLTWRSLSVEDPNGGIRPDRAPAFQVDVPLAPAIAGGTIIVEVNAYNNLGRKLGSVRAVVGFPVGHNPIRIGTSLVR